jgi:hypothetical protein
MPKKAMALNFQRSQGFWEHIRQIWGLPPFLGREEMPQNGHTETFSADDLSSEVVTELVNKLRVQA